MLIFTKLVKDIKLRYFVISNLLPLEINSNEKLRIYCKYSLKYAVDILKFYPPVFCNPFLKSVTYLTNSKYFFHLKYLIEL